MSDHGTTKLERLVIEAVEAIRDLAGAIMDNMPPQAQGDLAGVQVKLFKAVEAFNAELTPAAPGSTEAI